MLLARLAAVSLAALAFAPVAAARTDTPFQLPAPNAVHGFLLRADEPVAHVFPRTPSFAWNPVRGTKQYEFQLSTSSVFREGGILWSAENLSAPAVAIPIALPWITGTPYSLYARVRAITSNGATEWSTPFGFNVRWPNVPTPMPAYNGLVRWTPVAGATSYQVWYLEPKKTFGTITNVADEREYYTFRAGNLANYSTVHWRVRAVRQTYGTVANGLPAVSYGPWSPVYASTNTQFVGGPMQTVLTVSDSISNLQQSQNHSLMPAFVYTGDTGLDAGRGELFRVYIFTDKDCVNVVFRSAIVGSPAYAPRTTGPLALPTDQASLSAARTSFLADGKEGATLTYDNQSYVSNEELPPVAPDLTVLQPPGAVTPATPPASGSTTPGTTPAPSAPLPSGAVLGTPPVDLWDTDPNTGRYYWTVVPVYVTYESPLSTTVVGGAALGATSVTLGSASGLSVGDQLAIGPAAAQDQAVIVSISGNTVTFSPALRYAHGVGETVFRAAGKNIYGDGDLPQDVCADGRWLTFGKTSQPAVTQASAPYASGMSPTGRLTAAAGRSPQFYGNPLVAWQPAAGASAYKVQWSSKGYPFKADGEQVTVATSATLPLSPGTWYYRVRGINFSLPAGAQNMSWSTPVKVVVTSPKFRVVPSSKKK